MGNCPLCTNCERGNSKFINNYIYFLGGTPVGEMPVDISNLNNGPTKTNSNIKVTNNNMEQRETIPILNLYQPIKTRPVATKQETAKIDNNQELNKQESNIKETYSSTKKEISTNINNNQNVKKIHLFEFIQKNHPNTVEYYLNNLLKNNKSNFPPLSSQINSSLFKPTAKNSTTNFFNNNPNANGKNSGIGIGMTSNIQEDDESPFNVLEHPFPSSDEENISKILKTNDYLQDQTQDIINLIIK